MRLQPGGVSSAEAAAASECQRSLGTWARTGTVRTPWAAAWKHTCWLCWPTHERPDLCLSCGTGKAPGWKQSQGRSRAGAEPRELARWPGPWRSGSARCPGSSSPCTGECSSKRWGRRRWGHPRRRRCGSPPCGWAEWSPGRWGPNTPPCCHETGPSPAPSGSQGWRGTPPPGTTPRTICGGSEQVGECRDNVGASGLLRRCPPPWGWRWGWHSSRRWRWEPWPVHTAATRSERWRCCRWGWPGSGWGRACLQSGCWPPAGSASPDATPGSGKCIWGEQGWPPVWPEWPPSTGWRNIPSATGEGSPPNPAWGFQLILTKSC